jgi:hypothetical protein
MSFPRNKHAFRPAAAGSVGLVFKAAHFDRNERYAYFGDRTLICEDFRYGRSRIRGKYLR